MRSTAVSRWEHRVRGSLLLAACGDALGAPFEGSDRVDPAAVDAWMDEPSAPLRWTDDTASTLVVADHVARRRGIVDADELAVELARQWSRDPDRGYGPAAASLFGRLLLGVPWSTAAGELFGGAGSFGNGAAMRVAPVGLLPDLALSAVASRARRTAVVTHTHPWAVDGAVAQAVAVAVAARAAPDRPVPVRSFTAAVAQHVETEEVREALEAVPTLVEREASPAGVVGRLGNGVCAAQSVPAALAAFLRHPDDAPAALRFAICLGGDTDTIAAMTGALCGARRGESVVPVLWGLRLEAAVVLWTTAGALAAVAADAVCGAWPRLGPAAIGDAGSGGAGPGTDTLIGPGTAGGSGAHTGVVLETEEAGPGPWRAAD